MSGALTAFTKQNENMSQVTDFFSLPHLRLDFVLKHKKELGYLSCNYKTNSLVNIFNQNYRRELNHMDFISKLLVPLNFIRK